MAERRLPRILHVTRNLPPLVGGMERLNWHIADELSSWADVHVVGPEGSSATQPPRVSLTEVVLRPLWRFLLASAWRARQLARQEKPHLILAGSGLTALAVWWAARACGAHTAVYVHGLDVAVKHPIYKVFWHPVLRRMDVVIANSRPTAALVRSLGVEAERIRIIHPGVSLPVSPQSPDSLLSFRSRHNLGDAPFLLSVGRLTTRKGLREFVENALPQIAKKFPDILLVVIGDAPDDSLRADVQTRESIQLAAENAGVGNVLRFIGVITDPDELANAYQSAALHVFPVRELPNDPEGFGMVAIEAAAHGLPTASFATGGIIDSVAEHQSGDLVEPGNYEKLAAAVIMVLSGANQRWASGAREFAKDFAWPVFGGKMRDVLEPLAKVQQRVGSDLR